MAKQAILYDASLCIGCRGCQVACKQWNDREGLKSPAVNTGSYENPADLSSDTWLRMRYIEFDAPEGVQWVFMPHACMQCREAACVEVCPTQALTHHPDYDFVMVDRQKCNGCGYLIQQDVGKQHPKPCPACKKDCTFTNVTCYQPECGGPQSSNFDPTLM